MKLLNKNGGFTLVELAIVIVIIGLLVGGVLQGQELIKQAKWRSAMKEIDSYKAAMATFYGKYNCIPGDCQHGFRFFGAECGTDTIANNTNGDRGCNGNGNRIISNPEGQLLWKHLSLGKMIKGSFTAPYAGMALNNVHVPSSSIDNNVGISVLYSQAESSATSCGYVYCLGDPLLRGGALARNLFNLGGSDSAEGGIVRGGFFIPMDAYEFDVKFDDGLYYSGVISGYVGIDPNNVVGNCGSHTAKTYYNTHATYSSLRGCRLVFDTGF